MKKTLYTLLLIIMMLCMFTTPVSAATSIQKEAITTKTKKMTMVVSERLKPTVKGIKKITWKSNKNSVVTVKSGIWKAKTKGTAILSGKYGRKTLRIKVTVEKPVINRKALTLRVGKKATLKMKNTTLTPKWKSTSNSIAVVSKKGVVSAKRVGETVVSATVKGVQYKCKIKILKRSSASIVPVATPTPTPRPRVTSTPAPTSAPPARTNTCWISATGEKYHTIPNCGRMNPSRAKKMTVAQALSEGYEPCSKCW